MRYDIELKRSVPGTLGEYRSYFDDVDPNILGGLASKEAVLQSLDVLIDATPGGLNAKPQASHTQMVRMLIEKSVELVASVEKQGRQLSDLEVLIEGVKMTGNPAKMVAVAERIETAASTPGMSKLKSAQAKAQAMSLRQAAKKL